MTTRIIAVLLIALAGFGAGVKVQSVRWDAADKLRAEQEAKDAREDRRIEREDSDAKDAAVAAARLREQAAARSAAAATGVAGRLRDDLVDLQKRIPSSTLDACRRDATALAEVFGECKDALREMGSAAEGHANDSLMLQQGWPQRRNKSGAP